MDIHSDLARLHRGSDETAQLAAIKQLSPHAQESLVFDALCAVALKTANATIRHNIIRLLKPQTEKACHRFTQAAENTPSPQERRWALVNLSLLNCRSIEAQTAIRNGLNHPDFESQQAAVMSTGLFEDPDFLMEVERFMERNRFFFSKENVRVTASKIAEFINRERPIKRCEKESNGRRLGRQVISDI
jgi:hypothetical protein